MSDQGDSNDPLELAAAPPLVPNASLEAEEKAMRGGRGGLIAMLVGGVVLLAGGFIFLVAGDDADPWETFGRNVNGLKQSHFDAFWSCTFQAPEQVRSNEDLVREIHERASRGAGRFGEYVRSTCFAKLSDLEFELRALMPPDESRPKLNELIAAVEALRSGWSDYLAYLDTLEGPYAEEDASERVGRVARSWYDYKRLHGELNTEIRGHLN